MALIQSSNSLQVPAGSSPLLPIWGSQEHTSCQLLLSPSARCSSVGASEIAAEQPGCQQEFAAGQRSQQEIPVAIAAPLDADYVYTASKTTQPQQHEQQGSVCQPYCEKGLQQILQQLQWQLQPQQLQQQQPQQPDMQSTLQRHGQMNNQHSTQQQYRQGSSLPLHQPSPFTPLEQHTQQVSLQQRRLSSVPALDLSRVKVGSSQAVKTAPEGNEKISSAAAARDAELCFDAGSIRDCQLHPNAPLQDSRCYIYRAASRKELADVQEVLARLPQQDRAAVSALWDALLVARHDCELMAARGVRVSRDISRDWQETVSDLIDRVVAQDQELAQLKQQLKAAQSAAAAATTAFTPRPTGAQPAGVSPEAASAASSGIEELHAQIVRLKRQRDRLARDQQELVRTLSETHEAAQLARQEATETREQLNSWQMQAQDLQDQHAGLLQQNAELAATAQCLAARVQLLEAAIATGADGSRLSYHPIEQGVRMNATVGDRTSSIGSEGGTDQPKPDQTSYAARPRSPSAAKYPTKKNNGRLSPFMEVPDNEHSANSGPSPRCYKTHSRSKTPVGLSFRSPASHSIYAHASYRSSPRTSSKPASGVADHHDAHAFIIAATGAYNAAAMSNDGSAGFQEYESGAMPIGYKGGRTVCWGSAGGASQSASFGGGVKGCAGLGSSSYLQSQYGGTSKEVAAVGTDMPRSSDDVSTVDTSRASASSLLMI